MKYKICYFIFYNVPGSHGLRGNPYRAFQARYATPSPGKFPSGNNAQNAERFAGYSHAGAWEQYGDFSV